MGKIVTLEPSWRDWIVTNLQRSCTRESMIAAMVEKDFDPEFAESAVATLTREISGGGSFADRLVLETSIAPNGKQTPEFVTEPSRIPSSNVLRVGDHAVQVLTRIEKPEVLVLGQRAVG